jgi:hypothetical protein
VRDDPIKEAERILGVFSRRRWCLDLTLLVLLLLGSLAFWAAIGYGIWLLVG